METCIVLLSGGLDSTTVLAIANQKFSVHTLSFDYGQRHKFELESVKKIVSHFKLNNHKTIKIDLGQFGKSALTDNIDVPKNSEIKVVSSYWSDDESEESRAAFDDFWKSQDVLHDSD